ncbi:hypothetical protein [Paraburkholderia humisilvae]|uniref:SHOCT domain-containing protein n=1 Tax=Paraburkholderia humisilvae TaxID=627669 RepID=A0A6J5DB72_9BURK|nr:hypothetical protein [Paraburkholderia humisilvae]CAB3751173.1 hypothetical protein LMG29542_01430 [Paraburkholderia humisilvae]
MTERERRVNLQLSALDDAHRVGRVSRDEYRLRRRRLLATLSDTTRATGRDTVRRPASAGQAPERAARPVSRWRQRMLSLGVLGVVCAGLALFYWLMLRTA